MGIEWDTATRFALNGVNFRLVTSDFMAEKTTSDSIALLKDRRMLDLYVENMASSGVRRILEFGIFEAGSAFFLALLNPNLKYVGLDVSPRKPLIEELIREYGLQDRIKLYWEVSQDNAEFVRYIIKSEFGDERLDVIIDDASHQYHAARASFEAAFHYLKLGGLYCLEDWSWSHWAHHQAEDATSQDKPGLSNLVVELMMVLATHSDIISEVRATHSLVMVRKGTREVYRFALDSLYRHRARWTAPL